MQNIIGFSGSVNLPEDTALTVTHQIEKLIAQAEKIYVGCALGVDALVIDAMMRAGRASDLSIFTAFGPVHAATYHGAPHYSAPGASTPISNLSGVAVAGMKGADVHVWAGGGFDVPLRGRLAQRSLSVVEVLYARKGELFAFPVSWPVSPFGKGQFPSCGSGTWSTTAAAAKRGVTVNVLPVVSVAEPLPLLPSKNGGHWTLIGVAPLLCAHQWTPTGALNI